MEIKALTTIWSDKKVQDELEGSVRNKDVYKRISKEMKEAEYDRDWE